jgi:hypothetical protein
MKYERTRGGTYRIIRGRPNFEMIDSIDELCDRLQDDYPNIREMTIEQLRLLRLDLAAQAEQIQRRIKDRKHKYRKREQFIQRNLDKRDKLAYSIRFLKQLQYLRILEYEETHGHRYPSKAES